MPVGAEAGEIETIGARQPQQHVGGQGPLVALEQRDIAWRDIEIGGHIGLGKAKVAAHPAQARTHIDRMFVRHEAIPIVVTSLQHDKEIL